MNKAKQVVETWARQFHSSPRDQRLAFLYLANDILQNSRRKGSEFVGEFWKVLPDALRDVIDNGDEFGRNSALRLVWWFNLHVYTLRELYIDNFMCCTINGIFCFSKASKFIMTLKVKSFCFLCTYIIKVPL